MAITWESEQAITQLTSVVDTQQLSTALDLTAAYMTKCELEVNSDQTPPVDALIWRIVARRCTKQQWRYWHFNGGEWRKTSIRQTSMG